MTESGRQAGAVIVRRPPAPSGRHAIDSGQRWSAARMCHSTWRLARRRAAARPATAALALAGILACATAAAGFVSASGRARAATPTGKAPFVAEPLGRAGRLPDAAYPARAAVPVGLIVPAVGIDTPLIRLRRTASGVLQVPATTTVAGWYTGSPRPGELGAAVIAGHVDSRRGPGVFFRLRLLRARDLILVRRADRSLAAFRVVAVRLYAKNHFPTAAVYGPAPVAELDLVTCGGTFDSGTGHYLGDVIVFAVAVRWQHRAHHTSHRTRQPGPQARQTAGIVAPVGRPRAA